MDTETKVREYAEVPAWVDPEIDTGTLEAIQKGGCASGAYMAAVTYTDAVATMSQHGDEVFEYLADIFGEIPRCEAISWSHLAVHYLSTAVDIWAVGIRIPMDED